MKVHEYQSKALLKEYGIPVPPGEVAQTPAQAREIAARLGGEIVVKAQVHAGGRGKGGGIKIVSSPAAAEAAAAQIMGQPLVTHQTGPRGVPVPCVLVTRSVDIARELYLSIVIDPAARGPVLMASEAGGMDIEEVAAKTPEKILHAPIDPVAGFQAYMGRRLSFGMNLAADQIRPASDIMGGLYRLFRDKDCSLAEINPLAMDKEGKLWAVDAKLNFDDNALGRHQDVSALRDPSQEDALELQAISYGITNYIKLGGNIGCLVNGAGLAMATMDTIKHFGGDPANFLDIGGVARVERVVNAFKLFVADPQVKAILVNIYGGIARVDIIAQGIVDSMKTMEVKAPIVVRLAGTNLEEGERILKESGVKLIRGKDLADAAQKAIAAAKGGRA
ncbi:MAG: ADP-forming succinate--CoA ligase subunit beta [Chloroflexi bacterium]|nr:ADP-forming succinate--CoA ligase subunit beta [Chloroflexota bacterium]